MPPKQNPNDDNDDTDDVQTVQYKVSAPVKIPPFWQDRPELWFAQIEAQFALHRIVSDAVRYNYIIGNLDGKVLQYVADAITAPPEVEKYKYIKEKILSCFAESGQVKISKLLSEVQLGDLRPSQLLTKQRQLAGTAVGEDFLRTLWLRQLPTQVQAILAASDSGLEELSKLADKIVEVSAATNSVNAVNRQAEEPNWELRINQLTEKIAKLESSRGRSQSRSHSQKRQPSQRRASRQRIHDKCWYHYKFGEQARKCNSPCTFATQKN